MKHVFTQVCIFGHKTQAWLELVALCDLCLACIVFLSLFTFCLACRLLVYYGPLWRVCELQVGVENYKNKETNHYFANTMLKSDPDCFIILYSDILANCYCVSGGVARLPGDTRPLPARHLRGHGSGPHAKGEIQCFSALKS